MKKQVETGWLLSIVLIVGSLCIAYVPIEIFYRIWTYNEIKTVVVKGALAQLEGGTSLFDADTGYRYRPNITVDRRNGPFPVYWRTNSHGHIARGEYPIEKPPGEFRIGLIGDSMTADVTNTVRWGDILEDILNGHQRGRVWSGGKRTRTDNLFLAMAWLSSVSAFGP